MEKSAGFSPFALSTAIHIAIFVAILSSPALDSKKLRRIVPALKVDLVGLPDHLKSETPVTSQKEPKKEPIKTPPPPEKPKTVPPKAKVKAKTTKKEVVKATA